MVILGLSGAFNVLDDEVAPCLPRGFFHDAAAAILIDGELVAAVEEERLTRIKHTNAFPQQAVARCLELAGVSAKQIDAVAYFFDESFVNRQCDLLGLRHPIMPLEGIRRLVSERLNRAVDLPSIEFVRHHDAHAAAAFYHSGFDAALVAIMDGSGEAEAISMYHGHGNEIELSRRYSEGASLGEFYFRGTRFLGFGIFDQYKVMGLAPHGNAAPFRKLFRSLYELHDDGGFSFDFQGMDTALLNAGLRPRRRHELISATHADFAAGLQETLETVALHLVAAGLIKVRSRRLCLAGGVAHNCTMNGTLARSGLADSVFVHPASHDAGAAVGSACYVAAARGIRPARSRSVFLGSSIDEDAIERSLEPWRSHIHIVRCDDPSHVAAGLLVKNEVIGWVQGRAEFGPRALGHRSILGDPRPVANRERINDVIKKREGFRPFAPAVTDDAASRFFDIASAIANPETMSFTVPVLPQHRADLGAVTHVDGSARVQVVRRQDDELFWSLINKFGELTGIPVVLNTSFNNSIEPIVDSIEDAMRCYLTTRLDTLFVGPFMLRRKQPAIDLRSLLPILVSGYAVVVSRTKDSWRWEIAEDSHLCDGRRISVSEPTASLLLQADGAATVSELISSQDEATAERVLSDLHRAWDARAVDLRPPTAR